MVKDWWSYLPCSHLCCCFGRQLAMYYWDVNTSSLKDFPIFQDASDATSSLKQSKEEMECFSHSQKYNFHFNFRLETWNIEERAKISKTASIFVSFSMVVWVQSFFFVLRKIAFKFLNWQCVEMSKSHFSMQGVNLLNCIRYNTVYP